MQDFANMYPVYKGQGLLCEAKSHDEPSQLYYFLWCQSYLASVIVGFLNTLTFLISIILSGVISYEKRLEFKNGKLNVDYLADAARIEILVEDEEQQVEYLRDTNEQQEEIELERLPTRPSRVLRT